MKKLYILLLLAMVLIGCQSKPQEIEMNKDISIDVVVEDLGVVDDTVTSDASITNVLEYNLDFNQSSNANNETQAEKVQTQLNSALSQFNVRKGIVTYKYYPEMIYLVMTSKGRITDIQLSPNEQIYSTPVIGDQIGWEIGSGKSGSIAGEISHIYIKPDEVGLETNMIINTTQRVYRFILRSNRQTYMPNIQFEYPQEIEIQQKAEEIAQENVKINLNQINFGYQVIYTGKKNKTPTWLPDRVLDDGLKTLIYIPEITRITSLPVLFAVNGRDSEVVNYRIRGKYFIVDGVFDELLLSEDRDKKGEIRIIRRSR